MIKFVLTFIITIWFINAFAQFTFQKTYGGVETDVGSSVIQTADGGYMIAGNTSSFGLGGSYIYLVKLNTSGDVQWSKAYGGGSEGANEVIQTSDGGYAIIGTSFSFSAGYNDIYIVKTDSIGNLLWSKVYGGLADDWGTSLVQTSDNGFILAGVTWSFGYGNGDMYVIKTDSTGNVQWSKTYGGSSFEDCNTIRKTVDGGFTMAGYTNTYASGSNRDIYMVKINSSGTILWSKVYGLSSPAEVAYDVTLTDDSGYAITGCWNCLAGADDAFLIKTNGSGNISWAKTYSGPYSEAGSSVKQIADGGYIITGSTSSFGLGSNSVYLIRTDSVGDTLWTRYFGGNGSDSGAETMQTTDGGFVIAGRTNSYGSGSNDIYFIKTDSEGKTDCISQNSTNTVATNISMITGSGASTSNAATMTSNAATISNDVTSSTITTDVYSVPSQPICLITVDSTSTKNIVVWEKPITTAIDSFRVYRDIAGNYKHIGSVAYNSLSEFVDTSAGINPKITSYRYKLAVVDTCGNESGLSDFHETIHLTVGLGVPAPAINLIWDNYEGFNLSYYRILRYNSTLGEYEKIDSVASSNFTYVDYFPPDGNYTKYLIEVVPPDVCTADKGKNWNSSKSNTSSVSDGTGVYEPSSGHIQFIVYPNPGSGEFNMELNLIRAADFGIKIFNNLGQEIYSDAFNGLKSNDLIKLDLKDRPSGIYNLLLITDSETVSKQMVIE